MREEGREEVKAGDNKYAEGVRAGGRIGKSEGGR